MSFLTIALVLIFIIDPVGNISSYLSLVKELDPKKEKWIILREMLIALAVMFGFIFLGEYIFYLFDVSETTVRITSGVILFLIAIKILFTAPDSVRANLPTGEPFIFPLAIPLIAGPALMATVMLFAHTEPQPVMIEAILLAWFLSVLILFFAKPIRKILGENGLMACERLIGMVLVLIAVQRILEGILLFWTGLNHPHA